LYKGSENTGDAGWLFVAAEDGDRGWLAFEATEPPRDKLEEETLHLGISSCVGDHAKSPDLLQKSSLPEVSSPVTPPSRRLGSDVPDLPQLLSSQYSPEKLRMVKVPPDRTSNRPDVRCSRLLQKRVPSGLSAPFFTAGQQEAFRQRWASELARIEALVPVNARWVDSHCHLQTILSHTWRGQARMDEVEDLGNLKDLVGVWPRGLEACISNCVFRFAWFPQRQRDSEWSWLDAHLRYFNPQAQLSSRLYFTIGIHPRDAESWDGDAERRARQLSMHPGCVGIGECGLDFFKHRDEASERGKQLLAFCEQVQLAVELRKPLVIHARVSKQEHEELCFRVLQNFVPTEHPVHVHCFSGSLECAFRLCERWPNLRIGLTGVITFRRRRRPNSAALDFVENYREIVQGLPLERLLIETDGPYMCPEPLRNHTAHPGHVHRVAEKVAELKQLRLADVFAATRNSTRVVYGI